MIGEMTSFGEMTLILEKCIFKVVFIALRIQLYFGEFNYLLPENGDNPLG